MKDKKYIIFDADCFASDGEWEGLSGFFKDLKVYGYHLAAVSSKQEDVFKDMLKRSWTDGYFEVLVGVKSQESFEENVQEALNKMFHYGRIEAKKVLIVGAAQTQQSEVQKTDVKIDVLCGYGSIEKLRALLMDTQLLDEKTKEEAQRIETLRQQQNQQSGAAAAAKKQGNTFQKVWRFLFPYLLFLFAGEFLRQAFAYVMMFLAEQNAGLFAFMFVAAASDEQRLAISGNGNGLIQMLALLGVTLVLYKMADGKTNLKKGENKELSIGALDWGKWLGTTLLLGIGLNMLFICSGVTTASSSYQETASNLYAVGIPIGLLLYGIASPLAEEFLFRGIMFNEMKSFTKPFMAAILSAAMFGIYHGNGVQFAYGTILGVILAQAYQCCGRFFVPVVLHGVLNVLIFLAGSFGIFQQNVVQAVLGIVLTLLGLILFYHLYRKDAYGTNH